MALAVPAHAPSIVEQGASAVLSGQAPLSAPCKQFKPLATVHVLASPSWTHVMNSWATPPRSVLTVLKPSALLAQKTAQSVEISLGQVPVPLSP